MSYLEKTLERLGFKIKFNPPGDGDCFFGSAGQELGQLEIESQNSGGLSFDWANLIFTAYHTKRS